MRALRSFPQNFLEVSPLPLICLGGMPGDVDQERWTVEVLPKLAALGYGTVLLHREPEFDAETRALLDLPAPVERESQFSPVAKKFGMKFFSLDEASKTETTPFKNRMPSLSAGESDRDLLAFTITAHAERFPKRGVIALRAARHVGNGSSALAGKLRENGIENVLSIIWGYRGERCDATWLRPASSLQPIDGVAHWGHDLMRFVNGKLGKIGRNHRLQGEAPALRWSNEVLLPSTTATIHDREA